MNVRERLKHVPQRGRVEWIGLAPAKHAPLVPVERARVEIGTGFEAEHHSATGEGQRQVTLIQAEHFPVIGSLLGREVGPADTRRNVVVSGINLASLKEQRFRIGDVLLEYSRDCPPCGRMEEVLGEGGFQAMRGHGGICASVLEAGYLAVGDAVVVVPAE
ncbi:MAG: MOSC domain-containing protein [Planctomycetota bacterium]